MQNINTPEAVFEAFAGHLSMCISDDKTKVVFIDTFNDRDYLGEMFDKRETRIKLENSPTVMQINGKAVEVLEVYAVPEYYQDTSAGALGAYDIAVVTSSGEHVIGLGVIQAGPNNTGAWADNRRSPSANMRAVLEFHGVTLAPEFEEGFAEYEEVTD